MCVKCLSSETVDSFSIGGLSEEFRKDWQTKLFIECIFKFAKVEAADKDLSPILSAWKDIKTLFQIDAT